MLGNAYIADTLLHTSIPMLSRPPLVGPSVGDRHIITDVSKFYPGSIAVFCCRLPLFSCAPRAEGFFPLPLLSSILSTGISRCWPRLRLLSNRPSSISPATALLYITTAALSLLTTTAFNLTTQAWLVVQRR